MDTCSKARIRALRQLVGDYGVALFAPLNEDAFELTRRESQPQRSTRTNCTMLADIDRYTSTSHEINHGDEGHHREQEPEPSCRLGESKCNEEDDDSDGPYHFEHEVFPVQIEPEDESCLAGAPRLISESMLQELVDNVIPRNLRIYKWKRIFSIDRDGDGTVRRHSGGHGV